MTELPTTAMEKPGMDGWFAVDRSHRYQLRVFYEDTDAGGVVYHANYLRFMERGRTSMLRLLGYDQSTLARPPGVAFAVRRADIDFRSPARLDDALEVVTRIIDIRGASFAAAQSIERDGRTLVAADILIAALRTDAGGIGKPARTPPEIRRSMERILTGGGGAMTADRPGSGEPDISQQGMEF